LVEWKKPTVRDFLDPFFDFMGRYKCLLGFIEKQPPQKALCLGPTPPPPGKVKFYRFFMFFHVFWAFNTAGKTVTKIGIYALPPPKSGPKCHFLANLSIFDVFSIFATQLI
jgi:hypothetical protein